MTGKPDLETFVERLQAVSIEPRFNVASTGNVAGVSFSVNDIAFKGSSLGKKFSWNTIKTKVKYDKNRDDELVRSFSARKDDEPNSIGRSLIEPNINDSRATDRIDDDIIRISQHSIESYTADTNKGEQLVRNNNYSFKLSKKYNRPTSSKVRRTTQKAAQIRNRVKKQHNKEPSKLIIKVASVVGVIHILVVLSVGYFNMQKQQQQLPINLDSKAVAISIVEQLRSKR
ncbi:hypothetical protein [Enterobacter ludwigii]|uniref:hypothetical protein n=1 Tax=Enterobacter ludwigii TaxID=299767 RepID=UPI0022E0688E|nr:hypothetical protein [Enterobacter ludwigii]